MKIITFIPSHEVCARAIDVITEDGVVKEVSFKGGCDGNLKGISKLVRGMKTDEVIERLEGLSCRGKSTSCPDQLTIALKQIEKQ